VKNDAAEILTMKHLRTPLVECPSGAEKSITSPYKSENCAWVMLYPTGEVKISQVSYSCLAGAGTIYGHSGRKFGFSGAELPYRIMARGRRIQMGAIR